VLRDLVQSGRVDYQWLSINDGICDEEHDEIVRRFDAAAAQIDNWLRSGKRVLVHCFAGVSRAVTAVVWYLVRYHGLSWDQALQRVRAHRTVANPNIRFEIPLRIASGEEIGEEWIERRIAEYGRMNKEAYGVEVDPEEVWDTLAQQGTFRRTSAAAG
jgi:hypothetical protein